MRVRGNHESLEEQLTGSVGNQTITFHFSQAKSTLSGSTFGGLTGEDGARSCCSSVHFVLDHVFEFLVVDGAEEDVKWETLAGDAGCETVFSGIGEAVFDEDCAHVFDFAAAKGGSVFLFPCEHACFSRDELEHFADCHAGGETMGVHDDVGYDALIRKGHVCLFGEETDDTLLAVARREFVADFWAPRLTGLDFEDGVVAVVGGDDDFVGVARIGCFIGHVCWRPALLTIGDGLNLINGCFFEHVRVAVIEFGSDFDQTVFANLAMSSIIRITVGQTIGVAVLVALQWHANFLKDLAAAKAAVAGRLVENESILDIVPGV